MAYTSGFFDAVDQGGGEYDREYSAATFAHYFSLLVKNGVFPDPSTGMQVKASTIPDMHVTVQPGSGWINGYYITVPDDAPEVLTVPTANPSLSRIDSVVMGLNFIDREIQLYIKSGAVSASPSPVSLQRDNDLYELELAQISLSAGLSSVTQSVIVDKRQDSSRCGIVKGTIDQIDTTDLFAQYNDAFQTWFADIQAQLSGDVATNLQNQVNSLKTGKADKTVTDSLQEQVTALGTSKLSVSAKATETQAVAGTDDTRYMTPKQSKTSVKVHAFEVGDCIESYRNNLGSNWLLCNGGYFNPNTYPELAQVTPPFHSLFEGCNTIKSLGASPVGYAEGKGYQVIAYENTGIWVAYSTNNFQTYSTKQLTTSRNDTRPNVFFVNNYFIVVHTRTSVTPGSLEVWYATTPNSAWTQGATDSTDFYGGSAGFGLFFDLWYANGKYYLAAGGSADTSDSSKYPYIVESPTPGFKRADGATSTKVSDTHMTPGAFIRTSSQLAFIGYYSSKYHICYSTPSAPKAYTYKNFTVSGSAPSSNFISSYGVQFVDNKFVFLGYTGSNPYVPVIVYTTNLTADSWTGVALSNLSDSRTERMPRVIIKVRDEFIGFGYYPYGTSTYASIVFGPSITSSTGWDRITTRDTETADYGTLNAYIKPMEVSGEVVLFMGTYMFKAPTYAVPKGGDSMLYKYIKAKAGV